MGFSQRLVIALSLSNSPGYKAFHLTWVSFAGVCTVLLTIPLEHATRWCVSVQPTRRCVLDWNRVEAIGYIIAGKRDQLEGKIQERYGKAKDEASREIDDWYNTQAW